MSTRVRVDQMPIDDDWWGECAMRWIKERAKTGIPFTAYQMILDGVPEPPHPSHMAGAITRAKAARIIRPTGNRVVSLRPAGNGCKVDEWVGVRS